ncbi:MAG: hypothetical protein E2579_12185 [Pseudomonas sp.]|nr:hypothetical protein [Pseudomonas sp.]MPT18497.1 hypothetical protein [Pseudomonas sp.]
MFYQLGASIDPKIIGKSELPLTVEIKNKVFSEQSKEYTLNINKYFEEFSNLYSNFPKELIGKMYQRKRKPIDLMNSMPYYPTLRYIISKKVKDIFKGLTIAKTEYHLEKLEIEGCDEDFYFLFIPLLRSSEYVDFDKTVYYDSLNEKYEVFGSYEKYEVEKKNRRLRAKTLYLKKELEVRDIISVQAGGPFYSERIIDAFQKENVVGYEIITGGDFKVDLHFS